ncbi:MAG: hypothetical protein JSU58_02960 [Dehalococcoidales bacterium]|nr:MAG: hypothetical protein JSU58_02960 [Dehalococcoidales bacterium]
MLFSVEIARQGGKNELSAQIELLLLTLFMARSRSLVKCSPTFKPQTVISMDRLKDRLNDAGFEGFWKSEKGYIIRLGYARALFLSADKSANVVGHTADILLEVDEAQDVSIEKYTKEFKPMGATTNTTTVLYGTAWDNTTLLEETKQAAYELEERDGIKRCFRYDWQEVAKYTPDYLTYVEGEKERLGENHPLFLTQYRLLPVRAGGGFLSAQQRAQLQGEHMRRRRAEKGKVYIAGIDLAGEAEEDDEERLTAIKPRQDSTVVTIGELDFSRCDDIQKQPVIKIVEHYYWTGKKHSALYGQLIDIIRNLWKCRRVMVDSTGVGQPVYSFLKQALGSKIVPFTFTAGSKSELGYSLLAAVNSGGLKMYAGDGSEEYSRFWTEMEKARSRYRSNHTMNFSVDPSEGHDDFLMSLALVVKAAEGYTPREAKGRSD